MKTFLFRHQKTINVILPVIIAGCFFYSGILGQGISKIRTEYLIDVTTLNNSFITLSINASVKNSESFQKTYNNLGEQMKKFNQKWSMGEIELETKETFKWWFDWVPYLLIFLMTILNAAFTTKKDVADTRG